MCAGYLYMSRLRSGRFRAGYVCDDGATKRADGVSRFPPTRRVSAAPAMRSDQPASTWPGLLHHRQMLAAPLTICSGDLRGTGPHRRAGYVCRIPCCKYLPHSAPAGVERGRGIELPAPCGAPLGVLMKISDGP